MNAEYCYHLLEGEETLSTQAAEAVLETVQMAQFPDDEVRELVGDTGTEAMSVSLKLIDSFAQIVSGLSRFGETGRRPRFSVESRGR